VRKTQATVQVALALMAEPKGRHGGYQLSKPSGLRCGVRRAFLSDGLSLVADDLEVKARWLALSSSAEGAGTAASAGEPVHDCAVGFGDGESPHADVELRRGHEDVGGERFVE
jgi:hypothetical protein